MKWMHFAVWTHVSFVFCYRTVATRSLRKLTSWNWRSNSWLMSPKRRQMVRLLLKKIIIILPSFFFLIECISYPQRKLNVFFTLVPRCYTKLQRRLWSVPAAGLCAPPAHEPRPPNLRARARLCPAVAALEFSVLPHVQRSHLHHGAIIGPARAASEPEMDGHHPERKARERHSGEIPGCAPGCRSAHVETMVDPEDLFKHYLLNNVHKQPRNVL